MAEVRQTLRTAFHEWHTRPDILQTDNELRLGGRPDDPYPSWLTLWLVGLGIRHEFIRPGRPTDQAQVEREHRTLAAWAGDAEGRVDVAHLQAALDRERWQFNRAYPSEAQDCEGRPPLVAHPDLLTPRRPYQSDAEGLLFDLARVDRYLATFVFERRISATGRVSLGRRFYSLGRRQAGRQVLVCFDRTTREWVFLTRDGEEVARRSASGLDAQTLMGVAPETVTTAAAFQLPLFSLVTL